jgi:transcriptional regulator with XRE-family HTH domain
MFQIGQSLRDARLAHGLELVDVEAATMIGRRYLSALETERFELLSGEAYTRLFLREYAAFLGLDPTPFLDQLATEEAEGEPPPFTLPPAPSDRRGPPGRRFAARASCTRRRSLQDRTCSSPPPAAPSGCSSGSARGTGRCSTRTPSRRGDRCASAAAPSGSASVRPGTSNSASTAARRRSRPRPGPRTSSSPAKGRSDPPEPEESAAGRTLEPRARAAPAALPPLIHAVRPLHGRATTPHVWFAHALAGSSPLADAGFLPGQQHARDAGRAALGLASALDRHAAWLSRSQGAMRDGVARRVASTGAGVGLRQVGRGVTLCARPARGQGDWWRSAIRSERTRSSRWRIRCRASVPPSRPNRRPTLPRVRSRSSRRRSSPPECSAGLLPERSARLPRAGRRLAGLARRPGGRALPTAKRRLRRSVVTAQRTRRTLSPPCTPAPLAPTVPARPARARLPLRHLRDQGAGRGGDLSRGTHLGRRPQRPPCDRHRLALGASRRMHARLARLPRLPGEDLRAGDARPLLAQGDAGRRGRARPDRLRRSRRAPRCELLRPGRCRCRDRRGSWAQLKLGRPVRRPVRPLDILCQD